jgi:hypothetical protein
MIGVIKAENNSRALWFAKYRYGSGVFLKDSANEMVGSIDE